MVSNLLISFEFLFESLFSYKLNSLTFKFVLSLISNSLSSDVMKAFLKKALPLLYKLLSLFLFLSEFIKSSTFLS